MNLKSSKVLFNSFIVWNFFFVSYFSGARFEFINIITAVTTTTKAWNTTELIQQPKSEKTSEYKIKVYNQHADKWTEKNNLNEKALCQYCANATQMTDELAN